MAGPAGAPAATLGRVKAPLAKRLPVPAPAWTSLGIAGLSLAGLLAVASAPSAAAESPVPAKAPELFYPGRDCPSRVLEVEVFDEAQELWSAHPDHARVAAESCVLEPRAAHAIRIRCIDPTAHRAPGPWRIGLGKTPGADRCQQRQPDPDGAGVAIAWPEAGSEIVQESDSITLRGHAGFEARESVGYEIFVVIDVSGSTAEPAGIDVDGDGEVGRPIGRPPVIRSSDPGDSVLAAEIQAVRILVERLEAGLGRTRVGILSFSGETVVGEGGGSYTTHPAVRVEVPLSDSIEEIDAGLDQVLARGSLGGTNFYAAIDRSLLELSGHWSAQSDVRPGAGKIIVLLTDGVPSPPAPGTAYADPANRVRAVLATRGAEAEGVTTHIYALGGRAEAFPLFVRAVLSGRAGSFTRVRNPGEAASFLRELQFASVREVAITNLDLDREASGIEVTPDGHFSAEVPVASGENTIRVRARSADGRERSREVSFRFVRPSDREALLEAERRRLEAARSLRKDLRIERATPRDAEAPLP